MLLDISHLYHQLPAIFALSSSNVGSPDFISRSRDETEGEVRDGIDDNVK